MALIGVLRPGSDPDPGARDGCGQTLCGSSWPPSGQPRALTAVFIFVPGMSSLSQRSLATRGIWRAWDYVGFKAASEGLFTFSAAASKNSQEKSMYSAATASNCSAEMALSEYGPMTRNPEIWRDEPHARWRPRFDHCNLHGPDIPGVVRFFTQALDFADRSRREPGGGRCRFPQPLDQGERHRLYQASDRAVPPCRIWLDSWHEVGQAVDPLARHDIPLIRATDTASRAERRSISSIHRHRNEVRSGGFIDYPRIRGVSGRPTKSARHLLPSARSERALHECGDLALRLRIE